MNMIEKLNILPDEKLRLVNGGDGGAIYGKDIDSDWQPVGITFTEATPSSNGGAIYFGSPESKKFCEIHFVNNKAGQSGGAIMRE